MAGFGQRQKNYKMRLENLVRKQGRAQE